MKKNKIDNNFDIAPMESQQPLTFDMIEYSEESKSLSAPIPDESYDEKHSEIEDQFQNIYNHALNAFDDQMEAASEIEGKYLARNTEVANQLLTTALAAAKEKASLKKHSDHLQSKKSKSDGPTTNIQNNFGPLDRNELLKMMKKSGDDE